MDKKRLRNKAIGDKGEDLAANFLISKGYKILHRNWRFGHKELDLVAKSNDLLIIVEVKTRATKYWEEPKESVRRIKQKHIIQAADEYVRRYNIDNEVRFDIISIILTTGKQPEIEHIEDAFYPTL